MPGVQLLLSNKSETLNKAMFVGRMVGAQNSTDFIVDRMELIQYIRHLEIDSYSLTNVLYIVYM